MDAFLLLPAYHFFFMATQLLADPLAQTFQGEINETIMAGFLSDDPKDGPKILRGGNVQRYSFLEEAKQGSEKYLIVAKYKKEIRGEKVFHTTQPRLGYQRNAALDNWRRLIWGPLPNPCYCFDSVSSLLIEGTSTYFYLALLNSSLQEWRFRLTSSNNHVSTDEVASLPIRRINFMLPPDQRTSSLEKARNLYRHYLDDNDQAWILSFVDHHLSQQPEESDVVHDLLAFLAEEMMRLNKEKRAAQRDFLDWLVATLKILPDKEGRVGIDALTGKARLTDYPGDYQKGEPALTTAEVLEMLRKNKNRLGVSLNDIGLVDRLEKMYEESLLRVLPLKETLRKTDALIDAVVYRLYGLTEEEIRAVEGKRL